MNHSGKASYGRILKSSALLGGSSLVNVLLRVIRVKVLAVQLGPAGFGILSLYSGLIDMIISVVSLGVGQSAVRSIASADPTEDGLGVSRIVKTLHRLVWCTGIVGLGVTVSISYQASWWTFNDYEHAGAIAVLGFVVLFAQLQAGQGAILSGLRRIGDVAASTVMGGVLGTMLAIPLLLWLGIDGVVPFLLAIALGQLVASWWYAHRVPLQAVHMVWKESVVQSYPLLQLGVGLMITGVATAVSAYAIRLILQQQLGASSVGLYTAAYTISGIYVGFILQAMSGDYFPRLTGVGDNRVLCNRLVNEQSEIATLLAVPGLIALLLLSDVVIRLLYSADFSSTSEVLRWSVLGMFGRIISWPAAFLLLARADTRAIIMSELIIEIFHVVLVWWGVKYFGVVGAGAAFAGMYFAHILLIAWLVRCRHGFVWAKNTLALMVGGAMLICMAFAATWISVPVFRYAVGVTVLIIGCLWSFRGLIQLLGREKVLAAMQRVFGKVKMKRRND